MITLIAFIFGLALSIILGRVAAYKSTEAESHHRVSTEAPKIRLAGRSILALTVVGCALSAFTWTFKQIPPGSVGIASLWGKVTDKPLTEGLNIVNPLYEITLMSVQIQKHEPRLPDGKPIPYTAASKDMQVVHVQMVLNYRLNTEDAPRVYRESGVEYEGKIIDPAAHEVLKAVMAQHPASEILQKRSTVKEDVQKTLATWLNKYGVELKEVSLQNISFDHNYEAAIEAKQIQEQKAEQKTYELQQAEKEAQIAAATAKGRGDALRAEAQGAADALKLKGDAEAEYNRKVAESLNPILIQQKWLERWNGQVPVYLMDGGQGSSFLLQMPNQPERTDKKK